MRCPQCGRQETRPQHGADGQLCLVCGHAWPLAAEPVTAAPPRSPADAEIERRLLADILAVPEDDAPRLVYADWLQERGDPRGDFIAMQCRPKRFEGDVFERAWRIERAHRDAWLEPFGLLARPGALAFVRGFVEHVEATADEWIGRGDALCARAPIVSVDATGVVSLAKLLAAPATARLRTLVIRERIGSMSGLQATPPLPRLDSLVLYRTELADAGIAALAKLRAAPVALQLDGNQFTAYGLHAALAGGFGARLERIGLDGIALGDELGAILARRPLRDAALDDTGVTGAILDELAPLESLSIAGARGLHPRVLHRLAAWPRLRRLGLARTDVDDAGAAALAEAAPGLRELDLSRCQLRAGGARALIRSALAPESLKLFGNELTGLAGELEERFGRALVL